MQRDKDKKGRNEKEEKRAGEKTIDRNVFKYHFERERTQRLQHVSHGKKKKGTIHSYRAHRSGSAYAKTPIHTNHKHPSFHTCNLRKKNHTHIVKKKRTRHMRTRNKKKTYSNSIPALTYDNRSHTRQP